MLDLILSFSRHYMYTSCETPLSHLFWQRPDKLFWRFWQSDRKHEVRESCLDLWEPLPAHTAPSYGSFIGRQWAWRTCTAVHVQESATLGNYHSVPPHGPTQVLNISIHVSDMKLQLGDCHKRQNRCLWVTAKNVKTLETTVSYLELLKRIL